MPEVVVNLKLQKSNFLTNQNKNSHKISEALVLHTLWDILTYKNEITFQNHS